jgi:hypothetical protein
MNYFEVASQFGAQRWHVALLLAGQREWLPSNLSRVYRDSATHKPYGVVGSSRYGDALKLKIGPQVSSFHVEAEQLATRSKTLAIKVCHTGTTQLNAMVEAPFTAATTASKNILYHTLKAAGYSDGWAGG